ncbi:MAG: hypothetical protein ABIR63_01670 [Sphingomicrobium sp.]
MSLGRCALLFALAAALAPPARAEAPKALFASDQPIHIIVQAPLGQLMRNRAFEGNVPGTVTDPAGLKLPASFALRGITRRTSETCDFAPLKVNFAGHPPTGSLFAGQNKLKLVTHCRNAPGFQQNVLLEYAAYRMYALLTPFSMRARLATIDYVDEAGRPIVSRVGFFLEDSGDVAKRNNMREVRAAERIPFDWLSPADAARYAVFQDLIANHDWSMRAGPPGDECCHNARLIGSGAPGQTIPVPYDFDFSGLVNAPYATVPDQLRINNVRERQYRGFCVHDAQALVAARQLRDKRSALLGVLATVPGMDPRTVQNATIFLDRFLAGLATDGGAAKTLKGCLG